MAPRCVRRQHGLLRHTVSAHVSADFSQCVAPEQKACCASLWTMVLVLLACGEVSQLASALRHFCEPAPWSWAMLFSFPSFDLELRWLPVCCRFSCEPERFSAMLISLPAIAILSELRA